MDCPVISQQLRALASENPRVAFIEKPQFHWLDLLDRSDLIVLPYEPNRYRRSGSGVATEAVSEAIPMVVPPGSTMENAGHEVLRMCNHFFHLGHPCSDVCHRACGGKLRNPSQTG
jgi:hypothetical protein